jgi:hypothetical protein
VEVGKGKRFLRSWGSENHCEVACSLVGVLEGRISQNGQRTHGSEKVAPLQSACFRWVGVVRWFKDIRYVEMMVGIHTVLSFSEEMDTRERRGYDERGECTSSKQASKHWGWAQKCYLPPLSPLSPLSTLSTPSFFLSFKSPHDGCTTKASKPAL